MKEKKPINQKRNEDNKASGDLGFETSSGGLDAPQYGGASNPDIPVQVLDKMQNSFQADFSNVNIRTNSMKAVDYNADAFTEGNDVSFAPGKYQPESMAGQELLAHELTHVLQQSSGVVSPTSRQNGNDVNTDSSFEQEADEMGFKASRGISTGQSYGGGADIQNTTASAAQFRLTPKKTNFYKEIASQLITGLMQQGIAQEKAFFVVAQVIQENGWSTDAPPGNNYFNIKGSNNGQSITLSTHEEDAQGNRELIQDEFRVYENLAESMSDYLNLLESNFSDAYKALYDNELGVSDFVTGLENGRLGRYATDADYSKQVTTLSNQVAREFGAAVPDYAAPEIEAATAEGKQAGDEEKTLSEYDHLSMIIFGAMKGMGTDEQRIYHALALLNNKEEKISLLKEKYQARYGIDLESHLRSEFSNTWIFGNELDQVLAYLNISPAPDKKQEESEEQAPVVVPETPAPEDGLSRVDAQKNDRSRVQNRWIDDDGKTEFTDSFNDNIETHIVQFFGEGYTRERVLTEIAEARTAGDLEKVEELRIKLFNANMYNTVEALDVENNSLHAPGGGKTYCNIYAYDVVTAMGGYLPRVWWNSANEELAIAGNASGQEHNPDVSLSYLTGSGTANNVREMNANSLNAWLPRIGDPYFGWEEASSMQAGQEAANTGHIVIISAANANASRSGHINVILPETEQYKSAGEDENFRPLQSQAGSSNFAHQAHAKKWWNNSSHVNGAAWIYKGEHTSPIMTPEQMGGRSTGVVAPTAEDKSTGVPSGVSSELLDRTGTTVTNKQGMVTANKLNIRPSAGTDQAPIGQLSQNEVVKIVGEANGWYQLERGGWVSGKHLTVSETTTVTNVQKQGTITASKLNVRPGPNTNGSPVSQVSKDDVVVIVGESNGWFQLQSGGWVSGKYLEVSESQGEAVYDNEQLENLSYLANDSAGSKNGMSQVLSILGGDPATIAAFKKVFSDQTGISLEDFIKNNFESTEKAELLALINGVSATTASTASGQTAGKSAGAVVPKVDNGYDDNWPLRKTWTNSAGQEITRKDKPDGDFGEQRSSHVHQGTDLNMGGGASDLGAPVYATHGGKVEYSKGIKDDKDGAGNRISIISADGKFRTRYFHLQEKPNFTAGQVVTEGQIIGKVGGSGAGKQSKYTPHLHYEVHVKEGGKWVKKDAMKNGKIQAPEDV